MTALPYAMLDLAASASDARRLDRMETIYHRGQALIWNGKETSRARSSGCSCRSRRWR